MLLVFDVGDGGFAPVSMEFVAVGGMLVVSAPGVLVGVLVAPRMRMLLLAGVFLSLSLALSSSS